ncbi:MAG: catalase family peroxidase [Verrucomicrobiota bacterium]
MEQSPTSHQKLATGALALRLVVITVLVGGLAVLFLYAGGWLSPHQLTPARFVDGLEQVGGKHPGFRRNHSKGVCVAGYFESNGSGAEFSKAKVFQQGRVPILGRFSLGGGMPDAADTAQTVRGLGICFQLPGADEWRTAMINLPVFPFRTPQAFYDQLLASAPDPATGKPDPEKMHAFVDAHPEFAAAVKIIGARTISSGFENSEFNGLNAFRFTDANGKETWARWSVVPENPEGTNSQSAPPANKNYLFDSLIAAVHRGPLKWRLLLTIAEPGDPTDDATLPWPSDRKSVEVGTVVVDHIESDDTSPARDLNFDPLILPEGISPSDDPLLSARSAVYSQSFTRREGEEKSPSPVSSEETEK